MARRSTERFTTIRTEGGLLPADLLRRLVEGDRNLEGLGEAHYHLVDERLHEAIARSWARLTSVWSAFHAALAKVPVGEPATGLTRERWLLPLFQELGYGRLTAARSIEVDGKNYPVSHAWQHLPIHLVGSNVDLDRKTAGVAGAARVSPHGLVQEVLNRSRSHLWGLVSNGRLLRLLRDSVSLTRQAYIEFDLEAMFDGEIYRDFVVLWCLLHQSRVEADRPEQCWLEQWAQEAHRHGTRVLEQLREGVEKAIQTLGRGFLAHPANEPLREALRTGRLDGLGYYRQLLRLVYRLLFLFVAEDRELLLDPEASKEAHERYRRYYSTARLRELAGRHRGTPHGDRWRTLALVMTKLGEDAGCPDLGLPALGSFLWSPAATPDLNGRELSNRDLLATIRALAYTEDDHVRRPVDYRNLGPEELGSVYEALLELHPEINTESATFRLTTAGGHERKTTGSYYTPRPLIQALLDSALDPVLDEAARARDPEAAILALKVCDPACGSGHFLIAAAHRIARRLAAARTGDEEPSPEALHHAVRDVIGRCIYGVDLNEMAVELCKVALWMEALEQGKSLSFLDHRIVCGNSLLGATPALLAQGIPDEAFEPIERDEKSLVTTLRKRNRKERQGQMQLPLVAEPGTPYGDIRAGFTALDAVGDESIAALHEKEEHYRGLMTSAAYRHAKLLADAWSAAFACHKTKAAPEAITEDLFRRLESNPDRVPLAVRQEVARLADQYHFLHWHLTFPDVFRLPGKDEEPGNKEAGWSGGFNVVLGNPPWDTLSPDAKEFFSAYAAEVRFQDPDGQRALIEQLLSNPSIAQAWATYCRDLYAQVHFFKQSGRYRLFAPGNLGKGDFNIYRMFVESALEIVREGGRVSQIVPEGLYNGANCMAIREALFDRCELSRLWGFENSREIWFKGIDSRTKFCIFAARRGGHTETFRAAFRIRSLPELAAATSDHALALPVSIVREFSPDALAVMELGSQLEIDIATRMYAPWPKFGDPSAGLPYRTYMREVDMGNDRELFRDTLPGLPVYEGRMVSQFDHRAKGYRSGRGRAAVWEDLPFGDSKKCIAQQWYVKEAEIPKKVAARAGRYRIGFCDVASPTNERTLVAALIPPGTICGDKVPTILFDGDLEWAYMVWLAVANSFTMDFLARKKVSLKMSYTVLDSLPFPRPARSAPWVPGIVSRALQLTCTEPEMTKYWNTMAAEGWCQTVPPTIESAGVTDEATRERVSAELDAIVAKHVFGLAKEELDYILETFPIVRDRDIDSSSEYRTKRLILEAYDTLPVAQAVVSFPVK